MNKINLLFIISGIVRFWERSPGIPNIVRGLSEKGFNIDLVSFTREADELNKIKTELLEKKFPNIKLYFIKASKKNPFSCWHIINEIFKNKKIHIVIGEIINLSTFLSLFLKNQVKIIAHEVRMPKSYKIRIIKRALRGEFSLIKAFELIRNVKKLSKKVDKVISNSHALNLAVISAFKIKPEKCFTIYRGIDTEFFSFKKRNSIRTIPELLFVGNIKPHKGVEDLFEALRLIDKPVKLILCGKGEPEYIEFLKNKTQNYKVPHQISFKGYLSPFKLLNYYQNCDIFVFPSHTEGMPRVLLEAMSCGCPVVCSDILPHKEAIINEVNGIMVSVKSPQSLAQGILKCINNPEIIESISINARKTIEEKFSKESEINKWTEVINQVIYEI